MIESEVAAARPTYWGRAAAWVRALRTHHWSKNLLIFAPLLLAHQWADSGTVGRTILGFAILLAVTSAGYLINDVMDYESDRHHPHKRRRPIASGVIAQRTALTAAIGMLLGSLVAALLVDPAFAAALSAYAVINFGYSVWLKKVAFLDTFVIAVLFSLRLLMGAALIGQTPPVWLLTFSMFLFFSLAVAKRHAELIDPNPALDASLASRGYRRDHWHTTLPLGVVTAAAAVGVAAIYLVEDVFRKVPYTDPEFLWFPVLSVAFFAARIWLLTINGKLHGDPVSFALRDPGSLIVVGFGALGFLIAL